MIEDCSWPAIIMTLWQQWERWVGRGVSDQWPSCSTMQCTVAEGHQSSFTSPRERQLTRSVVPSPPLRALFLQTAIAHFCFRNWKSYTLLLTSSSKLTDVSVLQFWPLSTNEMHSTPTACSKCYCMWAKKYLFLFIFFTFLFLFFSLRLRWTSLLSG